VIEYVSGDLLSSRADALVNAVNCVGVMGRGIALQFKRKYPENFSAYEEACKRGEVRPGFVFVYKNPSDSPRFILNFPTKRHWRDNSRIEDIRLGLADLVRVVKETGIASVAIPPLGSGLGGLSWAAVRPLIETACKELDRVRVFVYEPQ